MTDKIKSSDHVGCTMYDVTRASVARSLGYAATQCMWSTMNLLIQHDTLANQSVQRGYAVDLEGRIQCKGGNSQETKSHGQGQNKRAELQIKTRS